MIVTAKQLDIVRSNSLERYTKYKLKQALVCIFGVPEFINTVLICNQVKIPELVYLTHHEYKIGPPVQVLIIFTDQTDVILSCKMERNTNHG